MREAHAHLAAFGRERSALALADCADRCEALDRIRAHAGAMDARREPGWLVGAGLRVAAWPLPDWPTLAELDAACPGRPCFIRSFDYHACAVNSAAFAAGGFSPASPDPPGGVIVRDRGSAPTGLLLESAYAAVRDAVPEPTLSQWTQMVRAGIEALVALGYDEVHDLLAQPWLGQVLASLYDQGERRLRVRLYTPVEGLSAQVEAARHYTRPGWVELAGGKVFADGTLNSRTAAMLAPYRDPLPGHPCGTMLLSPAQLDESIARCSAHALALAVHAIGDAAVRAVLDAAARADRPRLRIEHAELVDAADIPRFAHLGVVASVQPCHLLYDIETLRDQMPDRLDRVLPLRDLLRAGLVPGRSLFFGSDVPIVGADPHDSIRAATRRARADLAPAIAPEQAISQAEAWACFGGPGPAWQT